MESAHVTLLKDAANLEELKKLFKKLALKFHPDKGGDKEKMQQLNAEYEFLLKSGRFGKAEDIEFNLIFPDLIEKLLRLDGLTIEVVGQWLWVSGETRKHRKILKELGFFYAPKKQMWYFRNPENKKIFFRSEPMPMHLIRSIYGSYTVNEDNFKKYRKNEDELNELNALP